MNRLFAIFALLLPLLFAAVPASAVMTAELKNRSTEIFWPQNDRASGHECPASQDRIRDAAIYGYDLALDVSVGPNLYAYCIQNPWTGWDPHGLKVEVKRTKKDSPNKPPAGMTSAQKSAWERNEREKDHGTHTEITVKAALLDKTTKGHTPEKLEEMRKSIVDEMTKGFTGKDGKNSWSINVDLRIVKSAKEIQEDDHELILHDFVVAKSFAGTEFGGYALRSDKQFESGSVGLGGNTMVLNMNTMKKPGVNMAAIAAHEFGHAMGLRHPDDSMNRISKSMYKGDNLMWHRTPASPAPVTKQQIDYINTDFTNGKLNQGRSSMSEASFYFSEDQYRKETGK